MKVEKDGPGDYRFSEIQTSSSYKTLTEIYVDASYYKETPQVWFDAYGNNTVNNKSTRVTTYGWLPADDAEMIGLALIEAARLARQRSQDNYPQE